MTTEPQAKTQSQAVADFQQIVDQALALTVDERVVLAHMLDESIKESEPDPEHQERVMEIVRQRVREIEAGTAVMVDGDEVMREVRAKLAEQRCE